MTVFEPKFIVNIDVAKDKNSENNFRATKKARKIYTLQAFQFSSDLDGTEFEPSFRRY